LYSWPNIIRTFKLRRRRWAGHVVLVVEKPEGRRQLGILRCGWEDNIKMDIKEIGLGCIDWIDLTQDGDQSRAFLNTVMNLWVP
jgi:hypothetical protein